MAYIKRITINGTTYDIQDAEARSLISSKISYLVADTLPEASVDTMAKIYLIQDTSATGKNIYVEWLTVRGGKEGAYTYSWEKIGTTETDFGDYVKKTDELTVYNSTSKSAAQFLTSATGNTGSVVSTGNFTPAGKNADSAVSNFITKDATVVGGITAGTQPITDASKVHQGAASVSGFTAANWSAAVSDDGVLSFTWTANEIGSVSVANPTFDAGFVTAQYPTVDASKNVTALTAVTGATAAGQTFTGTQGAVSVTGTAVTSVSTEKAGAYAKKG